MRKSMLTLVTAFILILNASAVFAQSYESQISSMSKSIAEKIGASGKKSAAVLDFTDLQGNVSELGRFIAEELSADLQNKASGFNILDRTLFKGALKAHRFSVPAVMDPGTLKKMGQTAKVDLLIAGVITPLGDTVRISCKIIATDTANVIGSVRGDLAKTKAITALLAGNIEPGTKASAEPPQKAPAKVPVAVAPTPPVTAAQPVRDVAAAPPVVAKPPQAVTKAQADNFAFEVKACRQSGQQVTCTISVANSLQKSRRLARCSSTLTDDKGRQYKTLDYASFGSDRWTLWADIHPGQPRDMVHAYEKIDSESEYMDIVLTCAYMDGKAVFEHIKLIR